MAVNPGMVFISLKTTVPSSFTKKSTLESPCPSTDLKMLTASSRISSIAFCGISGLMTEPIDKRLDLKYNIGNIHFMILDTSTTYFYINSLERTDICGTGYHPAMTKKDSIKYILENSKQIPFSKRIKTNQISDILNKYKKEILNDNDIPLMISFASKRDTVKGEIIPNLFSFMEKNGMKYYFIRRFNDAEINAKFK